MLAIYSHIDPQKRYFEGKYTMAGDNDTTNCSMKYNTLIDNRCNQRNQCYRFFPSHCACADVPTPHLLPLKSNILFTFIPWKHEKLFNNEISY